MNQDKWFETNDMNDTEALRLAFTSFLKTPGEIHLEAKRNWRPK